MEHLDSLAYVTVKPPRADEANIEQIKTIVQKRMKRITIANKDSFR